MKKFIKEFRDFAVKGNVMDLAVAVIIGAAFQGVVKALTDNILSPIIGLFNGQNFDTLEWNIAGVAIRYGAFITAVINFLITAFVIFLLVRAMNRLLSFGKKEEKSAAPTTKKCPYCLTDVKIEATRCPACTSSLAE